MKKLVFTIQVLGLIAMFPIVVVLDNNHGIVDSSESIMPSPVLVKAVTASVVLPGKVEDNKPDNTCNIPSGTLVVKNDF